MRDLEWDNETQRAAAYVAYRYPNPGPNITIRMRPNHYFGAPVVDRTGYTAETLWRAAVAEGSFAKVAEYYEVGETSVMAACRYCEELQLAA
jgi:uncharacterized protein (DUF433 family)